MNANLAKLVSLWPGHEGVNLETTSDENAVALIADAVRANQATIKALEAAISKGKEPKRP